MSGLNPSLHRELVHFILKETIGRVKIFERLSPEFQVAIFPLLKPQTYNVGERLCERGDPSDCIYFLVKGEIEVLDHKKGNIVVKRLRPQDQEYVANGIVFFKETANGVIGMSAIVGRRRATTMVASQISEVLLITKEALARREAELEASVAAQYQENLQLRSQAADEAEAQLAEAEARCIALAAEVDALAGSKEEIRAERDVLEEKLKRSQARAMQANQALLEAQMSNVETSKAKRESFFG